MIRNKYLNTIMSIEQYIRECNTLHSSNNYSRYLLNRLQDIHRTVTLQPFKIVRGFILYIFNLKSYRTNAQYDPNVV